MQKWGEAGGGDACVIRPTPTRGASSRGEWTRTEMETSQAHPQMRRQLNVDTGYSQCAREAMVASGAR